MVSLERENSKGLKSLSSKRINGNTFSRTLFFFMKVVTGVKSGASINYSLFTNWT